MSSPLVITQWLQENLDNPRLVLIDASGLRLGTSELCCCYPRAW
ncbi:hypothetical protein [Vreelandella azerica]|nr:hypothetical protein [Halomonas azerica]